MAVNKLDAMAVFLCAVESGSLSGASRRLHMPLATVSRKVAELEAELGTRLLNRTSRRLIPSDAGRSYAAACKRILDDVRDAERLAAGEFVAPRGDLSITAPIVFGRLHVLPVVSEFLKAYPDIDIRLVLTDSVVDLQEERVDVAVRIGELPDSSLVAMRIGAVNLVVCGSPAYFAVRGLPPAAGDLGRHDCITFLGLTSPTAWTFSIRNSSVVVPIRSRLVLNTAEAAIDAASAGLGVTRLLSYQVAAAFRTGALVPVLGELEPQAAPINLVHTGQRPLPLKLRAFLDFAAPRLKSRLQDHTG
jgi:DNA-binding transcriptional LysR family regulator